MSISSLGSVSPSASTSLASLLSTSRSANDVAPPADAPRAGGASRFATAISDAFGSLGISLDTLTGGTSTSASTATSTAPATDASSTTASSDGSDALASFVQSLFAALHAQSGPAASSTTSADDGSAKPVHHGHGHGGGHRLEADLESLAQKLTASGTDSADPASTTATTANDASLAPLEDRFRQLLAQSGASATTTDATSSLATFLKSLASGLQGATATGNVVSTQA